MFKHITMLKVIILKIRLFFLQQPPNALPSGGFIINERMCHSHIGFKKLPYAQEFTETFCQYQLQKCRTFIVKNLLKMLYICHHQLFTHVCLRFILQVDHFSKKQLNKWELPVSC